MRRRLRRLRDRHQAKPPALASRLRKRPRPVCPIHLPSFTTSSPREKTCARVARNLPAFEHGVVRRHALRRGGDGVVGVRVPEQDVGVFARGELALLRHAEDARGRRAAELDELLRRDAAALTPKCQRICRRFSMPGPPLGILLKSSLAQRLLLAKRNGQWSVETTESVPSSSASHSGSWLLLFAQRRREDVLRFVPAFAGHLVFDGEHEVLRAGLGQSAQAACLRMLQLAQRILIGEMHDVDGGAGHVGERDGAMRGFGLGLGGRG